MLTSIRQSELVIETAAQAATIIRAVMPTVQHEERFFVLPLDSCGKVLAKPILVSVGHTDGSTAVDPKEVLKAAFKAGADAIIVAHNHPSGNLTPSKADLRMTEELRSRAEWLGLEFVDHIIVTSLGFSSVAEAEMR